MKYNPQFEIHMNSAKKSRAIAGPARVLINVYDLGCQEVRLSVPDLRFSIVLFSGRHTAYEKIRRSIHKRLPPLSGSRFLDMVIS